jgi:hypothetical protein
MPIRVPQIPSYCTTKTNGLAYVRLGTEFVYLGAYDSPERKLKYDRVIGPCNSAGRARRTSRSANHLPMARSLKLSTGFACAAARFATEQC